MIQDCHNRLGNTTPPGLASHTSGLLPTLGNKEIAQWISSLLSYNKSESGEIEREMFCFEKYRPGVKLEWHANC